MHESQQDDSFQDNLPIKDERHNKIIKIEHIDAINEAGDRDDIDQQIEKSLISLKSFNLSECAICQRTTDTQ
jgi:hypothetical protein